MRAGIRDNNISITVEGDRVRDFAITAPSTTLFPYDADLRPVSESEAPDVHRFLWPYRTLLWLRREPNGNHREIGLTWWEWSRFQRERFRTPLSIAFSFVATHNHFALDRGGKVFNRSAPVIKLPAGSSEADHFALLGLLSSSTACFWMKQVFHPKGATSANRNHPDPERFAHEFSATGMEKFPVPEAALRDAKLIKYAEEMTELAEKRNATLGSEAWTPSLGSTDALTQALGNRW